MDTTTLKQQLNSVGVSVNREGRGMVLRSMATGEKLHSTPFACVDLGWELYNKMKKLPEFKTGDIVTFCAYPEQLEQDLKAVVRNVSTDNQGRVLYDISGKGILSITTGASLKESVLFKPFKTAFSMILERGLIYNVFKSEWLTDNCYQFNFSNSNQMVLIRLDSKIVELYHSEGFVIQSEGF